MPRNKLITVNSNSLGLDFGDFENSLVQSLGSIPKINNFALPTIDSSIGGGLASSIKGVSAGGASKLGSFMKSGTGSAVGNAALGAAAGIVGNLAYKGISGGLDSGAGSTVNSLGSMAGGIVGSVDPVLGAAITAGSGILGGGVNALVGTKTNQAAVRRNNEGTAYLNNFTSNAGSFDEIEAPRVVGAVENAYKGGVFKKGWARRKNEEMRRRRAEAQSFANRSVENNVDNLVGDQLSNALASYAAYGGPLGFGEGAVGLMQQNRYFDSIDKRSDAIMGRNNMGYMGNMGLMGNVESYAFGGELGTNGTDFTNGLLEVNAGGTHESNPLEGVPMGVDAEGTPNLVEEGETVYNDYVFSNRLKVPEKLYKELGLGGVSTKRHSKKKGKGGITFADASKKLAEESEQRPNDPISIDGLEASLAKLAAVQEAERMKKQMKDYAKGLQEYACGGKMRKYEGGGILLPEVVVTPNKAPEKKAVTNTLPLYLLENMKSDDFMPTVALDENNDAQKKILEIEYRNRERALLDYLQDREDLDREKRIERLNRNHGYGKGGKLFPWGGLKDLFKVNYSPSNGAEFIPYSRDLSEEEVLRREADPVFQAWTKYVNDNWDSAEVQDYLKALDAAAGGNHLFDAQGNVLAGAKDYYNHARTGNHKWGYYHLTPEQLSGESESSANPAIIHPTLPTDPALRPQYVDTDEPEVGDILAAEAEKKKRESENPKTYPTWMRYAPIAGAGAMALTDAFGLTNRPDYTYADKLEAAAESAGYTPNVGYQAIGDYLTYRPFDRMFYTNQLQANARATDRWLANSVSPSKAAGILANGYNTTTALGSLGRQAEEYNQAQRQQVADFNRKTNMFNSQMGLEASIANARYRQAASQMGLSGLAQAAALRDTIDQRVGAAKAINLNNLLTSLGNIGRENFALNQINTDAGWQYGTDNRGRQLWKGEKKEEKGRANGGKLKNRKK